MPPLLQDLIVGAVALGAVALVVRRIVAAARPEPTSTACEHCEDARTPPSS